MFVNSFLGVCGTRLTVSLYVLFELVLVSGEEKRPWKLRLRRTITRIVAPLLKWGYGMCLGCLGCMEALSGVYKGVWGEGRRLRGVWGGSVRGCGRLHVNAKDVTQECSLFLLMDSSPTDSSRHSPSPSPFLTSPPSSTLPPIYIFHTFPTISILRHHLPHIDQPLRHP